MFLFAKLVNPSRVYGDVHEEVIRWLTREEASLNQLVLLPRAHMKSHIVATYVAWLITRDPSVTILYVSATSTLAEKQLYAIKNILSSGVYQRYWPKMLHRDEGKREKWTQNEISVDHPTRKTEGVRDSTIFAAGLTTNITGLHCDVAILDDVVVPGNAYTTEGRTKVATQYSQLSSIENTDAREVVVGTRYSTEDLYGTLLEIEETFYEGGEEITKKVYEVFEKVVEDSPTRDGSGEFLWPKQRRADGRYFGFDSKALAKKKAKYIDKAQFLCQYYNDTSNSGNADIKREYIQYYNREHVKSKDGTWYVGDNRVNLGACIDFAFSTSKLADFTAIVIVGMDKNRDTYVMDCTKFKTSSIRAIFEKLLDMHSKWGFSKLKAEVSVGQRMVVEELRQYMKSYGIYFRIEEYSPTKNSGSKEERMDSVLIPRYESKSMWHYKGGSCHLLEEELLSSRPPHDDLKDALTNAMIGLKAPFGMQSRLRGDNVVAFNSRFGGVSI